VRSCTGPPTSRARRSLRSGEVKEEEEEEEEEEGEEEEEEEEEEEGEGEEMVVMAAAPPPPTTTPTIRRWWCLWRASSLRARLVPWAIEATHTRTPHRSRCFGHAMSVTEAVDEVQKGLVHILCEAPR
jgi:hypothetical protein